MPTKVLSRRRAIRRERGSIVVFMAMLLVVLAMLFGAIVPLATQLRARSTRSIDALRARLAFEAGIALVKSQSLAMTLVLGTPIPVSINGVTGTVTPVANDAQLAKSLLVTGTMTRNGRSYRFTDVIGARQPAPFQFAICSNTALVLKKASLGSAGANGDAFSNSTITLSSGGGIVNGNLMAVGAISAGSNTVTGRTLTGQTAIAWPALTDSDYRNEATSMNLLGLGSYFLLNLGENGIAFPAPTSGKYPIRFYEGDLNLKGTISGKGTIYVRGNLTISGDVLLANSASQLSVIVNGNINANPSVSNLDGYYFCAGTFNHAKDLTIGRGALTTNIYSSSKDFTIVRDNAIRDDTDEAVRLRLPYYWP